MPIPAERLHKHSVSGLLSEKQSFLSTPAEGRGINNQRSGLGSNDIFFAGGVISLDADGFTVGSNNRVNNAGTTYYWIAFKEDALSLKVSTYTGDGVDNHVIPGVGFTPVAVLGFREGTSNISIKTSSISFGRPSPARCRPDTTRVTAPTTEILPLMLFPSSREYPSN